MPLLLSLLKSRIGEKWCHFPTTLASSVVRNFSFSCSSLSLALAKPSPKTHTVSLSLPFNQALGAPLSFSVHDTKVACRFLHLLDRTIPSCGRWTASLPWRSMLQTASIVCLTAVVVISTEVCHCVIVLLQLFSQVRSGEVEGSVRAFRASWSKVLPCRRNSDSCQPGASNPCCAALRPLWFETRSLPPFFLAAVRCRGVLSPFPLSSTVA